MPAHNGDCGFRLRIHLNHGERSICVRIDKFLSGAAVASRKEAARAAKKGAVLVNGKVVKDLSVHIDPENDRVIYDGKAVEYRKYIYVMLNKPAGYVSSTDDPGAPVVTELLPENLQKAQLFPCGRLDKYTVGLIILTNDGGAAHRMLSPSRHVSKTYYFELSDALSDDDRKRLEAGVDIGGYVTKPCSIELITDRSGNITITEGKYHQIKRMAEKAGNRITFLRRISFAGIELDAGLPEGKWRYLNESELAVISGYLS